jgi:hypothetical protein
MVVSMNREDIIRMARKAGLWPAVTDTFPKELQVFAALVASAEREACAVIAETPVFGEADDITMEAKDRVAKAIRARGQA